MFLLPPFNRTSLIENIIIYMFIIIQTVKKRIQFFIVFGHGEGVKPGRPPIIFPPIVIIYIVTYLKLYLCNLLIIF